MQLGHTRVWLILAGSPNEDIESTNVSQWILGYIFDSAEWWIHSEPVALNMPSLLTGSAHLAL